MTEKCFDIGEIQAFLDGELASGKSEAVARHISACDDCAILFATAEEETSFAFSALEQEFNTLVPTERLWTKINDSIEQQRKPFWKPIFAFLLQPSTAAFASLLFVAVVSVTLLSLKPDATTNYTALTGTNKQTITQPILQNQPLPIVQTRENAPAVKEIEAANIKQSKHEIRPVKAVYVEENKSAGNAKLSTTRNPDIVTPIYSENISGEDSYIKTIATLTDTVNTRKDEVLSASARFAFERDLAMTNDAIEKMRREVKKNPNNEAARQILRSSYQNKIDLLNSVAGKTELMASLK